MSPSPSRGGRQAVCRAIVPSCCQASSLHLGRGGAAAAAAAFPAKASGTGVTGAIPPLTNRHSTVPRAARQPRLPTYNTAEMQLQNLDDDFRQGNAGQRTARLQHGLRLLGRPAAASGDWQSVVSLRNMPDSRCRAWR